MKPRRAGNKQGSVQFFLVLDIRQIISYLSEEMSELAGVIQR